MAGKRLTRAQNGLIKASRNALRPVTLAEKLANPGRYSLKGSYFVAATVKKAGARTAFVTRSLWQDVQAGVPHSRAAKERSAGLLSYKDAASEARAQTAKQSWQLKRAAKNVATVERPTKGGRWKQQHVSKNSKRDYIRLRRRKLAGHYLDDIDWHSMMDAARAAKDPELSALMKS